jgi:dTDP-4-dehydrorhamnose 3,5-epimerase
MIQFQELAIPDVYLIENFIAKDDRGLFVKTFHQKKLAELGLAVEFKESYYSQSVKSVIRGMHFQAPPHDHEKLVYVTQGTILDVILDLRANSPTYGKAVSMELNEFGHSVFIPKGCAHGFLALSKEATVVYNVTTVYSKVADKGVLWNSFGFNWPVNDPIISARDQSFPALEVLQSYFPS